MVFSWGFECMLDHPFYTFSFAVRYLRVLPEQLKLSRRRETHGRYMVEVTGIYLLFLSELPQVAVHAHKPINS